MAAAEAPTQASASGAASPEPEAAYPSGSGHEEGNGGHSVYSVTPGHASSAELGQLERAPSLGDLLTGSSASPSPRGHDELRGMERLSHLGGPSEAQLHSKSWVRRVQTKTEELRRMFGLPPDEQLMDDYICALSKRVLLQGRLYVFEEHLCFHSTLFGYSKTKVIPLAEVSDVRKRKNVGFPNSIEISWRGKREFFTSFVAREDAYRLIVSLWRQVSEASPGAGDGSVGSEDTFQPRHHRTPSRGHGGARVKAKRLPRGVTSLVQSGANTDDERNLAGVRLSNNSYDRDSVVSDSSMHYGGQTGSLGGVPGTPSDGKSPEWREPGDGGVPAAGAAGQHSRSKSDGVPKMEFETVSDTQCESGLVAEFSEAGEPAPPLEPDMQKVLEFDLTCSPPEFWCRFLSNHSEFYPAFHRSRGDTNIRLSNWQRHYKVGMVRDLQFVSPLKMKMGPSQTFCHQTQRYKVHSGSHLVLETTQVMSDIPYSDHFRVESRWDVTPLGEGCHVTVHTRVPFSKNTLWKRFIEKSVTEQMQESFQIFKQMAHEHLASAEAGTPRMGGATPASAGAASHRGARTSQEWDGQSNRPDLRALRKGQTPTKGAQLLRPGSGRARRTASRDLGLGERGARVSRQHSRALSERLAPPSQAGSQARSSSQEDGQAWLHGSSIDSEQPLSPFATYSGKAEQPLGRAVGAAREAAAGRAPTLLLGLLGLLLVALQLAVLLQLRRMAPPADSPAPGKLLHLQQQLDTLQADSVAWQAQLEGLLRELRQQAGRPPTL